MYERFVRVAKQSLTRNGISVRRQPVASPVNQRPSPQTSTNAPMDPTIYYNISVIVNTHRIRYDRMTQTPPFHWSDGLTRKSGKIKSFFTSTMDMVTFKWYLVQTSKRERTNSWLIATSFWWREWCWPDRNRSKIRFGHSINFRPECVPIFVLFSVLLDVE